MKRRYRYSLNVLSLGLLAFALYLNFVRKEPGDVSAPAVKQNSEQSEPGANKTTSAHVPVVRTASTFELK